MAYHLRSTFAVLVLLTFPAAIAHGEGAPKSVWREPAVLFGDSIAFGLGSTPGHDLGACLKRNLGFNFKNLAVPGAGSAAARARLPQLNEAPRTVLLSVGGNDLLADLDHVRKTGRWAHLISPEETLANVRSLFEHFRAVGARVIFLDLSPPLRLTDVRSLYAIFDGRLRKLRRLAERFDNVTVVPHAMRGIWGREELLWDSLHPNDRGYQVLCERVVKALATNGPTQ